jgi:hypothetical protein
MESKKPVETLCNWCGLPCTANAEGQHPDYKAGLIDACVQGGYESTPGNGDGALDDATSYHFSLCEFCLDWLFSQFRIPVRMTDYTDRGAPIAGPWRCAERRVNEDAGRTMKERFFTEARRRAEARNTKEKTDASDNDRRA